MNRNWVKTVAAAAISAALLAAMHPMTVLAEASTSAAAAYTTKYRLTDAFKAEVKSVLSEKAGNVTRIGAVVRLQNTSGKVVRVPDYEIRVNTKEGIPYTLEPSAGNASAVQPEEEAELTYMVTLDRNETVTLSELSWVDVDEYVYPQTETTILTVPIEEIVWRGDEASIQEPERIKKWGEPFQFPDLAEGLVFTPVNLLEEKTSAGPVSLITLLAENTGAVSQKIPAFSIDGRSDKKTFAGLLLQPNEELKPGEKKNLYIAIAREQNTVLNNLFVVTRESFTQPGQQTAVQFSAGRMSIALPDQSLQQADLPVYWLGENIVFDPNSKLIDSELNVSLVDLSLSGNDDDGYQTVMAKLLLKNSSERPMPLPALGMELTSASGSSYTGSRQTLANQTLMPNLGYVVHYSFTVPSSEKGELMILKMMDNQTAAPYSVPIASYKVAVGNGDPAGDTMKFYPYDVDLKSWSMNTNTYYAVTSSQVYTNILYAYKLKLDLDIRKLENVVVDGNSSKMKIELVDKLGRTLGSESFSFTGVNKLISGEQSLTFSNIRTEQQEYPLTIKIYEAITTQAGEAKRLVKTLQN